MKRRILSVLLAVLMIVAVTTPAMARGQNGFEYYVSEDEKMSMSSFTMDGVRHTLVAEEDEFGTVVFSHFIDGQLKETGRQYYDRQDRLYMTRYVYARGEGASTAVEFIEELDFSAPAIQNSDATEEFISIMPLNTIFLGTLRFTFVNSLGAPGTTPGVRVYSTLGNAVNTQLEVRSWRGTMIGFAAFVAQGLAMTAIIANPVASLVVSFAAVMLDATSLYFPSTVWLRAQRVNFSYQTRNTQTQETGHFASRRYLVTSTTHPQHFGEFRWNGPQPVWRTHEIARATWHSLFSHPTWAVFSW